MNINSKKTGQAQRYIGRLLTGLWGHKGGIILYDPISHNYKNQITMKHILLQKALRYKRKIKIEEPKGFSFNSLIGAWVNNTDSSFLILSKNFRTLATKKNDIETGEDQKGQ